MQFGNSIWKDALWTHMFQTAHDLTTVKCGATQFTLYELKKELKERGHDIDLRDLIDSLKICNLANISVQKDDGKAVMQSAIFPTLLIASKEEWLKNPRNT